MQGEQYQVSDLQKVYTQIIKDKSIAAPILKDHLGSISRMLVWDDQRQTDLFDFACEVRMFETLVEIFGKCKDKETINVILGFFTTLLTNLTRQPSVNYLLSHSSIAGLQLTKFGNMGHEVADYYINFLKVLARKVNLSNLYLFYNKRFSNFPLLTQTTRFYNHPDNLVRTTARNIVLSIAKLKQPRVDHFMSGFPFVTYFIHECNFIKQYWSIVETVLHHIPGQKDYELSQLQGVVQDQEEVLIFIDDLLGLNQVGVTDRFLDAFLNECLSPLVIALDSEHQQGFSIKVVLFVLIGLFKTFTCPKILDALALVVFGKYYTKDLANRLLEPTDRLLSYDKKWKFKGFWDSYEERVLQYCSEQYHQISAVLNKTEQSGVIETISRKIDTMAVFGVTNNFYQRQIQKVERIFGLPIISTSTEVRVGGSKLIDEIELAVKSETGVDLETCQINPVSEAVSSYLNTKDDSLVLLTTTLMHSFFKTAVSPQISQFCKLSLTPKAHDFESIVRIQKMVTGCIRIFQADPPCYRLCTYLETQNLASKLITLYKPADLPLPPQLVDHLKLALKIATQRISPYLYGKKWEQSLQIYQQVSGFLPRQPHNSLLHFGLIPDDESELDHLSLPQVVYQHFPRQFEHQIARDFWIYILARDLFLETNSKFRFAKVDLPGLKKGGSKYEQGKTYYSIEEETVPGDYKGLGTDRFEPCQIILMQGYFAIICNQRVELKGSYDEAMVFIDKSDPRKLHAKLPNYTFTVGLLDTRTALQLRKHFQDSKSVLLRYKLAQMVKQTEQLLTHCKM